MQNVILQISSILHIPSIDVYFLAIILLIFFIFCALWITKIYEVLFWLVLGIAIFIVFQYLLLNPNLSIPSFVSHDIAKYVVWSSIYLIFILSILIPINWSLHIHEPKNKFAKYVQILLLSILLTTFYVAIIIWFLEKTYIYTLDNAFIFIKKLAFWTEFSTQSAIYKIILKNVPNITLFWVFFVIYRITFWDLVNMVLNAALDIVKKMWKWGGWGGGKWGWWGGWGGWGGWGHH
ncbi:MAG: hypothetical protein ACD_3C00082G0014 [uncultured bacterium (gcode 4)]|uniref:Uncharacterized protein n=1 Tax=uncultured bacterium (gcode 4) TaxID=1234023 RepID=K2G220_9BACT|nr:MAG: hypothetical protein ACD_3C00082G0014 [uncultured bacterium (gcode 4)]